MDHSTRADHHLHRKLSGRDRRGQRLPASSTVGAALSPAIGGQAQDYSRRIRLESDLDERNRRERQFFQHRKGITRGAADAGAGVKVERARLVRIEAKRGGAKRHGDRLGECFAAIIAPMKIRGGGREHALGREGDEGDSFYVCVQGKLEVTAHGRALAVLGPGNYVGEIALLSGGPRVATVVAAEPTRVLCLGREDFLATLAQDFGSAVAVSEAARRRRQEAAQ